MDICFYSSLVSQHSTIFTRREMVAEPGQIICYLQNGVLANDTGPRIYSEVPTLESVGFLGS